MPAYSLNMLNSRADICIGAECQCQHREARGRKDVQEVNAIRAAEDWRGSGTMVTPHLNRRSAQCKGEEGFQYNNGGQGREHKER